MKEKEDLNVKKKKGIIISAIIILFLGIGTLMYRNFFKKQTSDSTTESNSNSNTNEEKPVFVQDSNVFKDYLENVEYGTTWSYQDIMNNLINEELLLPNSRIQIKFQDQFIFQEHSITFKEIGSNIIQVTILQEENEDKFVQKDILIEVTDTIFPSITGVSNKEINVGDTIQLTDGINATDPVDGTLPIQIEGTVNTQKEGNYSIIAYAVDDNGNKTEQRFTVVVKAKKASNTNTQSANTNSNSNKKPTNSNSNTKPSNSTTNTKPSNSNTNKDASTKEGRLALAKEEAKKVIQEIITPEMTDYEKAEAICDYITRTVDSQTNQSSEAYKTNFGNEAYAALIMKIAACSGRCEAVMILCELVGLKCQHLHKGEWSHQWNKVLIDGQWLVLDSQIGLFGTLTHPLEET